MSNDVELNIQSQLSKVCGDLLYCDIKALETVCNDILLHDEHEITSGDSTFASDGKSSLENYTKFCKLILNFPPEWFDFYSTMSTK